MPHSNLCPVRPAGFVQAMGGLPVIALFLLNLTVFVLQSSLTQYVQSDLQFRQPYFLLYVAHSSFTIIFPLHVLYLSFTTGTPLTTYFSVLRKTLASRLSSAASDRDSFPIYRLTILILALTAGINIPSLLWYAAVSLTSISDVTALWNTNSFWVYVLSPWLCGGTTRWEFRKLGAVLLATIGVIIDVYGGSTSTRSPDTLFEYDPTLSSPPPPISHGEAINNSASFSSSYSLPSTAPLAGDLLTLIASIAYALYEVLYKRYVALPSDDVTGGYDYDALPVSTPVPAPQSSRRVSSSDISTGLNSLPIHSHYQSLSNHSFGRSNRTNPSTHNTSLLSESEHQRGKDNNNDIDDDDTDSADYSDNETAVTLPLGLYANLLTSSVGICTAIVLSFGFPLLHWASLERFRLPPDTHTALCIAGIALSSLIFNASFMVLLGLWGPILTSVGNLLTIVLVIIADFFFNHGTITFWSLTGAVMIASAFAILALDMMQPK